MNKIGLIICLILLNILISVKVNAQVDSTISTLYGTVRNAKDIKIQGVTIAIINVKTQNIYRGKTDVNGE